jgi:hypothetical protein
MLQIMLLQPDREPGGILRQTDIVKKTGVSLPPAVAQAVHTPALTLTLKAGQPGGWMMDAYVEVKIDKEAAAALYLLARKLTRMPLHTVALLVAAIEVTRKQAGLEHKEIKEMINYLLEAEETRTGDIQG